MSVCMYVYICCVNGSQLLYMHEYRRAKPRDRHSGKSAGTPSAPSVASNDVPLPSDERLPLADVPLTRSTNTVVVVVIVLV
jgi:hypothetical protein